MIHSSNLCKLFLLIVWCLFLSESGKSQGWERVIHRPGITNELSGRLVQTQDKGYLFFSRSLAGTHLFRMDQDGSMVWEKLINGDQHFEIKENTNQGFTLIGNFILNDTTIIIRNIDENGNTIDSLTLESPNGQEFLYSNIHTSLIKILSDGSFLVILINKDSFKTSLAKVTPDGSYNWIKPLSVIGHTTVRPRDMTITSDNGIIMSNLLLDPETGRSDQDIRYLAKLNENGEKVWEKETTRSFDLSASFDGSFFASSGSDSFLYDAWGTEIEKITVRLNEFNGPNNLKVMTRDRGLGYVITGVVTLSNTSDSGYFLAWLNDAFQIQQVKTYGNFAVRDFFADAILTEDHGVAMLGSTELFSTRQSDPDQDDVYLIKTDSLGNSLVNYITGNLYQDINEDCQPQAIEPPLSNWFLKAENTGQLFYGKTDSLGHYQIAVDTGTFNLQVIRPNIYWEACDTNIFVQVDQFFDTLTVDHSIQVSYECPLIKVDVSTPFLRRCYDNTYYINYCNEGTITSTNTSISATFDSSLIIQGSSPFWQERTNQNLRFEIGDVPPGVCGTIEVMVTVDCENTVLGQSHCVEVHAFPDTLCTPPGLNWDGSSLEVFGQCLGDSIEFIIENVGEDMDRPTQFRIIEEDIIYFGGVVRLNNSQKRRITTFASGKTFRIEVDQSMGHPGSSQPSVTVEGCVADGGPFSTGYVINNPFDEGDPFVAIDCQENVGSWDPNDIQAFPRGNGAEHWLDSNTAIEYKIRFQNTGTDTAFRVIIRDTLPPELAISSIKSGSSSHPYQMEIINGGILKFTFDPIVLPDSNVNEAASHGFVQFKIAQQPDLTPGTTLENSAAIYFDFNEPVITNTAFHTIRKPIRYHAIEAPDECSFEIEQPIMPMTVDTIKLAAYDSIILWSQNIRPAHFIEMDTAVLKGTVLDNEVFEENGVQQIVLTNQYGCDSIIQRNIIVGTENQSPTHLNFQIAPNPINRQQPFIVSFNLPKRARVQIRIFNLHLQLTETYDLGSNLPLGNNWVKLDAENLSSGINIVQLSIGGNSRSLKFILEGR